jgi:hypothetical protein
MKINPGYASLPACYRQVTYFLSIRLIDNSTLEAMRTQGLSAGSLILGNISGGNFFNESFDLFRLALSPLVFE